MPSAWSRWGGLHLQLASDGTSAIVHVETNPPTVCAIAYGKTASLGSIADDPQMGGTAISVHTVVLGGLSPGTTYRFRLTATDAEGTVFQTQNLASFTTPARPPRESRTSPSAPRSSPSARNGAARTRRPTPSMATCRPSGPQTMTVTEPSSPSTWDDHATSRALPSSHARCRTDRRSRGRSP